MNPITLIAVLSIILGLETIGITILLIVIRKKNGKLRDYSLELLNESQTINNLRKLISDNLLIMTEQNIKVKEASKMLQKGTHQYTEMMRLNKESEQSLKDIIKEHDKDMREQRERFEVLMSNTYDKKELVEYIQEAFKAGNNGYGTIKDYIKDFKANL